MIPQQMVGNSKGRRQGGQRPLAGMANEVTVVSERSAV